MDMIHEGTIEVELKYCERCGGLWLRPKGLTEVYCAACVPKMAELPEPRKGKREPRLPVGGQKSLAGRIGELQGVCWEGGAA